MSEFLHFSFSAPNIIATFILCFCVLYWIIVMLGAIDLDFLDIDIEMDADTDTGGSGESGVAWLNRLLHFFNLGRFPFMIWLTIVGLITWFGTVTINFLFSIDSFLFGFVVFIVAFIGAVIISKPLTFPIVKMFDALERSDGLKTLIGQLGEVLYANRKNTPGEVEIVHEGSHIRIFVLPSSQEIILEKKQKVLVISKTDHDDKIYIVEPYN